MGGKRALRLPLSHSIALTTALCLTAAAPEKASSSLGSDEISVSEKLRLIRENVGSLDTVRASERPLMAQNWRNCISGYWRNC
jgi:hypothetical protein